MLIIERSMLPQKREILLFLLPLWLVAVFLPNTCDSLTLPSQGMSDSAQRSSGVFNANQWQSLIKDAMKFIRRQKQREAVAPDRKPRIRFLVDPNMAGSNGSPGMMKLRNIRSGFGDVANAVRLYQLHELEKEWGSKARPRFGKRTEVTQDNLIPPFSYVEPADYEYEDAKIPDGPAPNYFENSEDRSKRSYIKPEMGNASNPQ